jgi:hypothetical protein
LNVFRKKSGTPSTHPLNGAANAAKCGATTPERLWRSPAASSCETRLCNKSWTAILVHAPMLAVLFKKATPELGSEDWCAWRRKGHCAIFVENVVFLGGLTFRSIKMSAAASSFYMAVRVVGLALMTALRRF